MRHINLGPAANMPVNTVRQIVLDQCPAIALYRLADGFYASDDVCTHGDASLAEGEIEYDEIVCPFHLGRFDIRTGQPSAAPCVTAIITYAVTVTADGDLMLELP